MKAKSFFFLAVVSGVVLGSFAVGEIEWPGDHDKGLVARANPTLAGIGELSVVIEPSRTTMVFCGSNSMPKFMRNLARTV
jgi:hypothetical protein